MSKYLIEQQLQFVGAENKMQPRASKVFLYREKIRPIHRAIRRAYYKTKEKDVKLPDFLVVGCQKCGTSSLHHYLASHPKVWSPEKKELHFFDYYHDLGLPFYKQYFSGQPDNVNGLLVGEATPEYIFHPYAAARIKKSLPDVKAIVLLRNPIERAFSAWSMGVRQGWEELSFENALLKERERLASDLHKMMLDEDHYGFEWNHHSYLLRGHYSSQIENWLLNFKPENLLVLSAERFFFQTKEEFKKVCDFLELDEWYPKEFKNMFVGTNNKINPKTRVELQAYYEPYNQKLYEMIKDDYEW